MEIPAYPDSIKEVLRQFLTLTMLRNENSSEVHRRLKELNSANSEFNMPAEIWYRPILDLVLELDSTMDIVIKEGNNEAGATITYTNEELKTYKITIHLKKAAHKWTIDQIAQD